MSNPAAKSAPRKLPFWQSLAFAAPGLPMAWLIPPMYAILGDFYLRHTAATAAGVGTAMIVSKIIDAVTDPPVGYLSDHTKSPLGARKPWIIGGTFCSMLTFYILFNPPENAGSFYFAAGIILYYISYTLMKIPYRAWLGEITSDYADRSRIWSYVTIGLLIGGVVIMVLPVTLSLPSIGLFDSAEFDRDMMSFIGWVGIIGMPICVAIAIGFAPRGERNAGAPPTIRTFANTLFDCRPFQIFMLGYGASALGFGVLYSIIIVALSSYFGLADRVPLFLLFMIAAQVASIPIWERIGARYSKHRTWAVAWAVHAAIGPLLLLIAPGPESFWVLVAFGAATSILQAPHMLFPVSIVNDIVDYDTLQTGRSRSGNFMSVYTFFEKVVKAVGLGIGYYIIAAFGYDPKEADHTFWEVFGLMTAVVAVPSLCFGAAAWFLFGFPIDKKRHSEIRAELDRREAASPIAQQPAR